MSSKSKYNPIGVPPIIAGVLATPCSDDTRIADDGAEWHAVSTDADVYFEMLNEVRPEEARLYEFRNLKILAQ